MRIGLVAMLIGGAASLVHAEPALRAGPVSLTQAIDDALTNNPEIGGLAAALDQTFHTVGEMRSQGLPKISGFGQITTSDDDVTQLPDSNQLVIRAQQTMFQGGRIASDINRLKRLQESAAADLDVKKLEIALLVEQSYFRAIADQEQLDLWAQAKSGIQRSAPTDRTEIHRRLRARI